MQCRGLSDTRHMKLLSILLGWVARTWDPVVWRSLLLAFVVVTFGTAGYTWVEGWSPWRALFFTLVTLTTVGYGDYGLSESGERFTAVLMIGGIGSLSYSVSLLLHRLMSRVVRPEKRMLERIKKMNGHTLVCGLGRTGQRVIDRLVHEGFQVVAIDSDQKRVESLRQRGVTAIEGDATSDDTLLEAGIERVRAVAAVTSSDAINALICLSAHALAPEANLIARAEDESSICKLRRAGAHHVMSPATYGGDGIAEHIVRPEVARLLPGLEGAEEGLQFAELCVVLGSRFEKMSIGALGAAHPRLAFVAARVSGGEVTIRPSAERVLEVGDVLVVAGQAVDVRAMRHWKLAA